MSFMERMMGAMMDRMSVEDKEAMMDAMMDKFFADISPEEKQKMMAEMMPKMMEGMNMADMMPKMMMGMMSGGDGCSCGGMSGMMEKMMGGDTSGGMPETMLKTMMPNCIEMMLPKVDADKRSEIATPILSALCEKGIADMSDVQKKAFLQALTDVLTSNK